MKKNILLGGLITLLFLCLSIIHCHSQNWVEIYDYPAPTTCISFDSLGNRWAAIQDGRVYKNETLFSTVSVWFVNELGLVGLLSDGPNLYYHVSGLDTTQKVIRIDTLTFDSETLITVPYTNPVTTVHHGGSLAINDSILYAGFGDGQSPYSSQDTSDFRGKIIAVNLTTEESSVFALGFRNPFRIAFDSVYQEVWVSDVGSDIAEEVNIIGQGDNAGWPHSEGDSCFLPPGGCDTFTFPILWYSQSPQRSIIGGVMYQQFYLWTDFYTGNGGRTDSMGVSTAMSFPVDVTSMAVNPVNGRLYLSTWDGSIFELQDTTALGIIEVPDKEYKKKDWYEYYINEILEEHGGDIHFDMLGRVYLYLPDYPGMFYSPIQRKRKIVIQ